MTYAILQLNRTLDDGAIGPLVRLLGPGPYEVHASTVDVLQDDLSLVMATARKLRRLGLDVVEVRFPSVG